MPQNNQKYNKTNFPKVHFIQKTNQDDKILIMQEKKIITKSLCIKLP